MKFILLLLLVEATQSAQILLNSPHDETAGFEFKFKSKLDNVPTAGPIIPNDWQIDGKEPTIGFAFSGDTISTTNGWEVLLTNVNGKFSDFVIEEITQNNMHPCRDAHLCIDTDSDGKCD